MPKKYLAGLLVAILIVGFSAFWLFGHRQTVDPTIVTLPPAQALGFLALPGLPQAWADLRKSKFFAQVSSAAFWQRALGPQDYQRLMEEMQQLEGHLGLPLTEPTMNLLLGREIALAVVPSQEKSLDLIVYARVSATEKFAERLAHNFTGGRHDVVRETQMVDDIEIVTLRPKDGLTGMSYAFLGTLAILSTDPAWVLDAIKAHHGTASDRLFTTPAFQALQLGSAESLLAYGYYDVERIQAQATAGLRGASEMSSVALLQRLQTTETLTFKATRADDGIMVETMAWFPPDGVTQVFRQVERDGAMSPLQGVPAETFYLTHVDLFDLRALWQLFRDLAIVADREAFQRMLAQFRTWAGVDLERDVLPVFTGVTGLGITAPLGAQRRSLLPLPGVFLTLGLTDASKGQQLVQTIGTYAGGAAFADLLQRRVHDGHTIYYLGDPLLFVKPGYVIHGQQLIVGSDISLLQHMLDADSGKTTTLSATNAYQDVRKHVGLQGESVMYVDVSTAVEEARQVWMRIGGLILALTGVDSEAARGMLRGNPWMFLEILRPIRSIGVASQVEAQGLRTKAFVVLQDL